MSLCGLLCKVLAISTANSTIFCPGHYDLNNGDMLGT